MTGYRRLVVWLTAALLLVACAPSPGKAGTDGPVPAAPKRVVAAILSDPPSISSQFVAAGSGTIQGGDALEDLVNAGLSIHDNRGVLIPQLAEAVPSAENGLWKVLPDGRMEVTWKIRPGAAWHDGAPLTTGDLLFSATLAQDKNLPIFINSAFELVDRVQALDDRTLVVHWKQPFIRADALFRRQSAFPRPRHILEPTYLNSKDALLSLSYWTTDYVGAGPFRLKQWVAGSHLILQANERYVLGRPKLDELEVRFIPDPNTLIANLLAGQVELTFGRSLQLSEAAQIRDRWNDGRIAVGINNWIALWVQFVNPNPQILLDVRFRRALLQAIDRQQMADTLEYGFVPIAHTFLSPSDPVYKDIESSIIRYEYDPRRALQTIEELGYTRGADGVLRDGAGQRLRLEVRTNPGHEERILTVSDYFKKVGIDAEPLVIPDALRNDREYNSTYPGVRLWRLPNDPWGMDRYHSKSAPLPENRFAGGNRSRYMNPDLDGLIDRYLTTIPSGDRSLILAQIVRHMTEQLPAMGIYYNTEPMMIANRLRNAGPVDSGGGATETWNSHEWDVRN